ncbi:peptidoglycan DD-metalloendopeptidase family protein [Halocynthiibacter sp. C4]|uniref:murein hydrolase activator EnvC family protein n=1 Tax=Halocynthiibacter sp. C4 TaxID=2992758 RepID=UPI00237A0D84|nr:peptidoglycan DD-metalloendopeptidase family protein [Halocynthiibacter sp. C4]MDE0590863.1 peptidoglycan DD-metalloendopeptidase family protein [Halocynthiibacter sp. C4]
MKLGAAIRALALILLSTTPALAEVDPAHAARRASQQISEATLALDKAEKASDRVAALTQTVEAFEEGLSAMREGLRRATIRERAIELEFEARREEVAQLIGVLQSMQSSPTPLLLLHPAGPLGTARTGMMLSDVTPSLQAKVEGLRAQLQEVATLRALQESAVDSLREGLFGAQQARAQLSQAISDRDDLPQRFLDEPEHLHTLLQSSETLEAFASGLVPDEEEPGALRLDFDALQGTLPLPASGTVLRRFNEADAAGIRRPGLLLGTQPLALVTAPVPATIRYRGPLLDYGNVMILEPQSGTLMVIAGMNEVYGEVGQVVSGGTAIGLMGGKSPNAEEFLQNSTEGSGAQRSETLYIEVRQGNAPVDPAPWFAVTKE